MDKYYDRKELDRISKDLDCNEEDMILIERIGDVINTNIDEDIINEIIFYSVMTSDAEDPKFIIQHPELCDQCGWCCRNIGKIELQKSDISRIGSFRNVSYRSDGKYNLDTPCPYINKDNKCTIYDKRPASCRNFPLGKKNGKIIVQRNINCGFIYNFLLNKVFRFIKPLMDEEGD